MTNREKAIVMAHTGICMLTGDKFQIFHKYVEDILNRPIMTHELAWLEDEIKEKSKADFIRLCTNDLAVDCVDRQDVERYIEGFINEYTPKEKLEFINLELDGLKHIPSVTPQEPKTGHWILRPHIYGVAFCSECGFELKINNTNYCPNCGAKMVEPQESEET